MKLPVFVLISCLSLATVAAEAPVFEFEGATAEVYKEASGDELRLYIFNPEGHDPAKMSRPAVVFFFGGGWNGGSPSQFVPHSKHLAARGMIAVVADYRVKSRQKTTPRECVADGKSAVRYLRANAERLGIDPERLAAGGGSAGGHVAAATGMIDAGDEPSEDASVSSKPDALLLFNPVYDNNPTDGYGGARIAEYWEEISPAAHISKDDPPAIVFLGTKDSLIPVSVAERFQKSMQDAGVKSELHLYEDATHGFFNSKKFSSAKKGPKVNYYEDTVEKMDAFLVDLGWLEAR